MKEALQDKANSIITQLQKDLTDKGYIVTKEVIGIGNELRLQVDGLNHSLVFITEQITGSTWNLKPSGVLKVVFPGLYFSSTIRSRLIKIDENFSYQKVLDIAIQRIELSKEYIAQENERNAKRDLIEEFSEYLKEKFPEFSEYLTYSSDGLSIQLNNLTSDDADAILSALRLSRNKSL